MDFGRLRELRIESGISQTDMANILKISRQAYNHYETGKREPSNETLSIIASKFNCSVDYLLGREQNNNISDNFNLTEHEKKLVSAYRRNADTQPYVDKLLGIEEDNPSIKSKFA